MIHRCTIHGFRPVDVPAGDRPDGPLVRDLACYVKVPRVSGDHVVGPFPFLLTGTSPVSAALDEAIPTPLDDLADLEAALAGDGFPPVDGLAVEVDTVGDYVIIVGPALPTVLASDGGDLLAVEVAARVALEARVATLEAYIAGL